MDLAFEKDRVALFFFWESTSSLEKGFDNFKYFKSIKTDKQAMRPNRSRPKKFW